MATDFPFSRTIVTIQSTRTTKKTGETTFQTHHYLSSQDASERTPQQWINLCRSHWAVENRNHYRRDVTYGEDGSRKLSGNPQALANIALLRNVGLRLLANSSGCDNDEDEANAHPNFHLHRSKLPAQKEWLAANPAELWRLIQQVP